MPRTKRLFNAVDKFAQHMKNRLAEKAELGFSGWNDPNDIPNGNIIDSMYGKVRNIIRQDLAGEKLSKKDLVDIGDFAMMLHHRRK